MRRSAWRKLELPTWFVAAGVYTSWAALTLAWSRLPAAAIVPAGAFIGCVHGSLLHEIVHGHPTRSRRVNHLIAALPLTMWLPFGIYRSTHLAHHRTPNLTDPLDDTESHFVTPEAWRTMSPLARAVRLVEMRLAGKLLVGPFSTVARFLHAEVTRLARGDRSHAASWLAHVAGLVPLVAWLHVVCGIDLVAYLALFVYPALSLTLLRSFVEHRPADVRGESSAVVEAGPVMSLAFLNNNLHAVHHASPRLPWYELPRRYRARRDEILAGNGNYVFRGYGEVARRFSLLPKAHPVHPGLAAAADSAELAPAE